MTASADSFSVHVVAQSTDTVRLVVSGELDIATAPELEAALQREMAANSQVLLDLSTLSFMDSSGIRALMVAINDAKCNGWNLGISATMSEPVRRTVHVTGVEPLLPLIEE